MSEPVVQFLLRIPASVKQKIEEAAKENNRSTNAEALVRLEKSFEMEAQENSDSIRNVIKEENAKLQESLAGILNGLTIFKKTKADE